MRSKPVFYDDSVLVVDSAQKLNRFVYEFGKSVEGKNKGKMINIGPQRDNEPLKNK